MSLSTTTPASPFAPLINVPSAGSSLLPPATSLTSLLNTNPSPLPASATPQATTPPAAPALSSTAPSSGSASTSSTSGGEGVTNVNTTPLPPAAGLNTTDVTYQDIKVYIEGVQVPFVNCSITQAIGRVPTAMIEIPNQPGLVDIARYYQPKVHIFFTDNILGGDRILFNGHITNVSYQASQMAGQSSVTFECKHKNALLEQVTLEWSAGGANAAMTAANFTDSNSEVATVQAFNFNSQYSMQQALKGINGIQSAPQDLIAPTNSQVINADPTLLSQKWSQFQNRWSGMPAVIMNMWNQLKIQVFSISNQNMIFSKMYMPLAEDGLQFFSRTSGHYFLENQIQNSKKNTCPPDKPMSGSLIMLPPSCRLDIAGAAQMALATNIASMASTFSNEMMDFYNFFYDFFYGLEYDLITLASPADVPVDPTVKMNLDDAQTWRNANRMAVETVVKPQLPYYYAPLCNVVLPNMYHSIQVNQVESDIPTRVTALCTVDPNITNSAALRLNYRAPQSIRESIARGIPIIGQKVANGSNVTLKETSGPSYGIMGKYELGRGIKHKKIQFPQWLTQIVGSYSKDNSVQEELYPTAGTLEYKNIIDLHDAWINRYGYANTGVNNSTTPSSANMNQYRDSLNPYATQELNAIKNFERILFATADYDYTKEITQSKSGTVDGIFNPYIVPGYPMDIINRSPEQPSFHALCGSVTHSITPRNIGTSISFMSATSYTELSNYFTQPISPWLQTALKMINVQRGTTNASNSDVPLDDQPAPLGSAYATH